MAKKTRIKDETVANLVKILLSGKDEDGSLFTDEHLKLSKENKFVEDFILTGIFLIEKLNIKNVVRFECDFMDRNNCPLRAIQEDGTVIPLDFDKYIDAETPRQYAYLSEAQKLVSEGIKPNSICKKIKEKSPAYLQKEKT